MSSFKKLRLDPEVNQNLSNQPGASGSDSTPPGRGYLDNSSFSSSTSGGNGTYNLSGFNRSSGPFRTRYSHPGTPSAGSPSFSRFAPYYFGKERRNTLKVPLIRARRDDSDSDRPSSRASLNSSLGGDSTSSVTSTTAQRIIETLQNLSTPVMNAGKIRIDQDIKAVQPLPFGSGSPLSRMSPGNSLNRSSGPPKMCSSLLLSNPSPANQISPLVDHRRLFCIPKMVDAATNTDKEVENICSPSQQSASAGSSKTGFESKTSVPIMSSKPPMVNTSTGTSGKSITSVSKDKDSDDEEFHECSSDITFSTPNWTPDSFFQFIGDEKVKVNKGNLNETTQQPPLLNGYKESASSSPATGQQAQKTMHSFSSSSGVSTNLTMPSAPSIQSFTGGLKLSGSTGFSFSASPLKTIPSPGSNTNLSLEDSGKKRKTIETEHTFDSLSPNKKHTHTSSALGDAPFKFGSSSPSGVTSSESKPKFSFGSDTSTKPQFTAFDKVDAAKSNTLSTSTATKVVATLESQPSSTLPPLTVKGTGSKWRCSTCMVENSLDAPKCVCCSEKNPNSAATTVVPALVPLTGATQSQQKKKWKCPTCMVDNELEVAACVCCSEKNPNPEPAPSLKKWSCPTCMIKNEPSASACVCCSEKNPNPVSTVGEKKDSSASGVSQPTFKFGISGSVGGPASSSPASTFSFGSKPSADVAKPFSFGSPVSTTSANSSVASSQPSSVTTPFKFGVSATTAVTSASATQSPATGPSVTTPASTGSTSFKFGMNSSINPLSSAATPSSTPSFSFGASAATVATTSSQLPSSNNSATTTASLFGSTTISSSDTLGGGAKPAGTTPVFSSPSFSSVSQSGGASGSFSFGGSSTTTSDSQKSTFSFGGVTGAAAPKPSFSSPVFSFGSGQPTPGSGATPAMTPTSPPTASTTPAPALGATPSFAFGSSNTSATSSPFGQIPAPASNSSQPPATGMFQFGGSTGGNPINPSQVPSFSLTPNLNFGAATPGSTIPFGNPTQPTHNAGSQPPPALFQFSATPSTAESPGAARQIKKAVRRFKR